MKKLIVMSIIFSFVLAGCGEKVEFTTKEYKKELLEKVYDKDEKAIKKYDEIRKKLEKQMLDGKEEATKELDRWNSIRVDKMFQMSPETQKIADELRNKTGKGW